MKRIVAILLVAALLLTAAVITVSAERSFLRGDADCSGDISVLDVTVIQRHLVCIEVPDFDEDAADVDGSGDVEIVDATWIQRKLSNLSDPFGIGENVTVTDAPTESETTPVPTTPKPTRDPDELPFVPKK